MSQIDHAYFGALDTDALDGVDVIWESDLSLDGTALDVQLWASPGMLLDAPMLDAFAALLGDLPSVDARARQQLKQYLEQDRFYIEHHVEQLAGTPVIDTLAPDGNFAAVDIGTFVAAMALIGVALWPDDPGAPVVMDYMIDQENSDEILAVQLAADGQFTAIAWES
jgi:hypothetical protein